jgi:uncharacterized protein YodC (DUF2158 family)
MEKYNINDFQIGDSVSHLSNTGLIMVVIEIKNSPDGITCRWVDKSGNRHSEEFLPQELGKASDFGLDVFAT